MKKLLLLFLIFASITPAQNALKKVKFAVHWLPQTQFAGYYIGVEKGIYAKYGFDVELIHSSYGLTSHQMLINEQVDFATTFLSSAITLRSSGFELVNIGQLSQRCGLVFVSKDKSLKNPSDLNGKKIGIWRSGFDEVPNAFVSRYKLDVEFVPINSTINLFLFGGVDLMTTMWYNEYHSILNAGINEDELSRFFLADYGFDVPEDGIYCLKKNYDKKTAVKFLQATVEAWNYAFEHPDETIELVKKMMMQKHIPFNKSHQTWMFNRIKDLFVVENKEYKPGELLREDFERAYGILADQGKITRGFKFEDFYFGIEE